jgi:hypothetical protein
MRYDAAVYSPDNKLELIAEVKARPDASEAWATQMRRNLIVHQLIPSAPYFLLALPDFFYLWRDSALGGEEAPPDYKVEAGTVLAPYLTKSQLPVKDLSEYGLELLVTAWLTELVASRLTKDTAGPEQQWLFDSGLYQAIRGGSVVTQAAA